MAEYYDMADYLIPQMMGAIDKGEAPTEEEMVDIYNMMDVFALPTAGEGFGIPTLEALACGKPVVITNYTTSYELIKAEDPYTCDPPLWPQGKEAQNGRDHLIEDDWSDRGCLVPYKDMWWDTPQRAAPQRGIVSEVAMAEAFSEYYHNPKKRLEHGKNARDFALEFYDWNTVLSQKWLDFAERVTKG
jgi:glycosyltransferase involved in cell wall biosynthesis